MHKVIFVCTANICRSPMAQYCLNQLILDGGLENRVTAKSAGTLAVDGMPITENSALVCSEHGMDASAHRSQHVTVHLLKEADLILGMELHHKKDLQIIFPQFASKIFLLKEFGRENLPDNYTVLDPYGQSIDAYRKTFDEIEGEVRRIWLKIKEQLSTPVDSLD